MKNFRKTLAHLSADVQACSQSLRTDRQTIQRTTRLLELLRAAKKYRVNFPFNNRATPVKFTLTPLHSQ